MSGVPVVLHGASLRALVVGGGAVAARKVRALVAGGANVRVVAAETSPEMEALASRNVSIERRAWRPGELGDALLVVAATDDREVNAAVAREAAGLGRLVNVADVAGEGNCALPAVHRAGALLVSVYAGGVPTAAARVRDAIAERFGSEFDHALRALGTLRERLLADGRKDEWERARAELIGSDFCDRVDAGRYGEQVLQWR